MKTKPQTFEIPVCPHNLHEYTTDYFQLDDDVECWFEIDHGEPQSWDHPGEPESMSLCNAWLRGVDIMSMLTDLQISTLEEYAMESYYG